MAQASPPIPAPTMMTFIDYFYVLLSTLLPDAELNAVIVRTREDGENKERRAVNHVRRGILALLHCIQVLSI